MRTVDAASLAPWTIIAPIMTKPPTNKLAAAACSHGAFARWEARHVSSDVQITLRKSCESAVAKFRLGPPRRAITANTSTIAPSNQLSTVIRMLPAGANSLPMIQA